MEDCSFYQQISEIESALKLAGYDPREQLIGYLKTGNLSYITRTNAARSKIRMLDQTMLRRYIEEKHLGSR